MRSVLFEVGWTDVLDVALVSVLLYATITWLRRTRAGFVVIGILILGGVYVAARELGLHLTAWIFQGFFAIFLILIVVIFQEELKHLFERLAVLSLRRGRNHQPHPKAVDTLVSCLADFARDRVGALVVIPGRDPIERHVNGGIELNGRLSEPLLRSIFDTHSPGHDGAVILHGERLVRFAVHLPLSKDFEQLGRVGTRHSAALGLSELTDALCLVVSEERGRISAARDGALRELGSAQEAGFVVQEFLRAKRDERGTRGSWTTFLARNWREKLASLAIVVMLWFLFVPGSKVSSLTLQIPVAIENMPSDLVLKNVEPAEVEATFSGVRRSFYLFEPKTLRIKIDASLAAVGRRTFRITEQNVKLPRDVSLDHVRPEVVRITVERAPAEKS